MQRPLILILVGVAILVVVAKTPWPRSHHVTAAPAVTLDSPPQVSKAVAVETGEPTPAHSSIHLRPIPTVRDRSLPHGVVLNHLVAPRAVMHGGSQQPTQTVSTDHGSVEAEEQALAEARQREDEARARLAAAKATEQDAKSRLIAAKQEKKNANATVASERSQRSQNLNAAKKNAYGQYAEVTTGFDQQLIQVHTNENAVKLQIKELGSASTPAAKAQRQRLKTQLNQLQAQAKALHQDQRVARAQLAAEDGILTDQASGAAYVDDRAPTDQQANEQRLVAGAQQDASLDAQQVATAQSDLNAAKADTAAHVQRLNSLKQQQAIAH